MNSKALYGIIFVLFCVFQLGYAIKCYRCDSEATCKNAKTYECNQVYANETSRFLDAYYLNVNTNSTSPSFYCMRQDIKFSTGTVKYKGCVYSHMNSCGYTFRPFYQQSSTTFQCNQCNNYNGCNPAGRKSVSSAAMSLPLVFVLMYKYLA